MNTTNIKKIIALAKKIELDNELIIVLEKYLEKDIDYVTNLYKNNSIKKYHLLKAIILKQKGNDGYLAMLGLVLLRAYDAFDFYKEKNISDKILYDTFGDIKIWCGNCKKDTGCVGLDNIGWIRNHVEPNIFRVGRLQFQFTKVHFSKQFKLKTRLFGPLKNHEQVINIHIPAGEPLTPNVVEQSLKDGKAFIEKHFPEYKFMHFICDSWLLYPNNKEFMKENSNILKFQKFFNIIANEKNSQGIWFIFGKQGKDASTYPEDTTLRKATKEYLLSGKKIGTGYGVIDKSSI